MLEHLHDFILHAQPDAAQVDLDDAIEFLVGDLVDAPRSAFDRGDVGGAIQAPVLGHDTLDQSLDVRGRGDVATGEERVAAGLLNHPERLLAAAPVDIRDCDLGAVARERDRGGAADTRGASGYRNDFTVKIHALSSVRFTIILALQALPWSTPVWRASPPAFLGRGSKVAR